MDISLHTMKDLGSLYPISFISFFLFLTLGLIFPIYYRIHKSQTDPRLNDTTCTTSGNAADRLTAVGGQVTCICGYIESQFAKLPEAVEEAESQSV